jgi:hypothetical protein
MGNIRSDGDTTNGICTTLILTTSVQKSFLGHYLLYHTNKITMDGAYVSNLKAKFDNIFQDEVFGVEGIGPAVNPYLAPTAPAPPAAVPAWNPTFGAPEVRKASSPVPAVSRPSSGSSVSLMLILTCLVVGILIGVAICCFVQDAQSEDDEE